MSQFMSTDLYVRQNALRYFNDGSPESKDFTVNLFTGYSSEQPNQYFAIKSDFTEVSGGGYEPIDLICGTWTVSEDGVFLVSPNLNFTFTGTIDGDVDIIGYYVVDNAGSGEVVGWCVMGSPFYAEDGLTLRIQINRMIMPSMD
jgi:hypothetical protein